MEFQIKKILPKKLVGKYLKMSFEENTTGQLWGSFAPRIKEISDRVDGNRISLQFYNDDFLEDASIPFVKWATVEVDDFSQIPEGLETLEIPGGLYAVFHYKGNVVGAYDFFKKIFTELIPNSEYQLDNSRAHFEILPAGKYDPMDENSEEEVYIPIKLR